MRGEVGKYQCNYTFAFEVLIDTPPTLAFSNISFKESDFAWKVCLDVLIEDKDKHSIIDLKTYWHDFQSTMPEDF